MRVPTPEGGLALEIKREMKALNKNYIQELKKETCRFLQMKAASPLLKNILIMVHREKSYWKRNGKEWLVK